MTHERARRTVAVLLAAGGSTRLGQPKQLLLDGDGIPLVRRMVRVLLDGGCDAVVVVTGAEADAVARAARGSAHDSQEPMFFAHNARYAEGMGGSIAVGVQQALSRDATLVLVATCDMPAVSAAHIAALLRESDGRHRVASRYVAENAATNDAGEFVNGVPALFPPSDFSALCELTGDKGARALLRLPETLSVLLRDGSLDLDTPADVERWRSNHHS